MNNNTANSQRHLLGILWTVVFLLAPLALPAQAAYQLDAELIRTHEQNRKSNAETFREWSRSLRFEQPEMRFKTGHAGAVRGADFSPDGAFVLSGGIVDTGSYLWDVRTGKVVRELDRSTHSWVLDLRFVPSGREYVVNSGRQLHLHDLLTGELVRDMQKPIGGLSWQTIDISPDGRFVAAGSSNGRVFVWSLDSGRVTQTMDGDSDEINSVAFSPDGRYLLSGDDNGDAILWHLETGEEVRRLRDAADGSVSVAFSPDGRFAVTAAEGLSARVWDLSTGATIRSLDNPEQEILDVAFSGDGEYVITVSSTVTGSGYPNVRVFDAATGELRYRHATDSNATNVRFAPDGRRFVVGTTADGAVVYSLTRDAPLSQLQGPEQVRGLALSPDGSFAAFSSGSSAIIWDTDRGRPRHVLTGHDGDITDLSISPEGEHVVTVGRDHLVGLWNAADGSLQLEMDKYLVEPRFTEFSGDGLRIVAASADHLRLWNGETGSLLQTIRMVDHLDWEVGPHKSIEALALSNNGSTAATGHFDEKVRLWDMETGQLAGVIDHSELSRAQHIPRHIEFLPGEQQLITVADNGIAVLWDRQTLKEVRRFEAGDALLTLLAEGDEFITGTNYTDQTRLGRRSIQDGELLASYHGSSSNSTDVSVAGNMVVSATGNGVIRFWDLDTANPLYAAVAKADGSFLSWTPDGYFRGDAALAKETVYFVDGLRPIAIDRFFDQYYRPDIVEAKIAGRDVSDLVGKRTAAESIVPLPDIQIEVERRNGSFEVLASPDQAGGPTPISQSDYRIRDGSVRIRVTARDTGGGAEALRVFHNGGRLSGATRGLVREGAGTEAGLQRTFTVELVDGENRIRAVAFSDTRVESDPAEIMLSYQAPRQVRPTLWLLSVGANEYRNPRYDLNYAVGDARGFARAVERSGRRLFTDIETTVILNDDVTRHRLLRAFESIADRARPEDVFMFFYAGHGIALQSEETDNTEFFFIMHDVVQMTSMEQVEELGISGPEFEELVTAIPARKQFHVLDACNAGAINTAFGVRGAGEEIALSRLSRATGSALIAASRDDQFAQEFEALGQGALTRAVLDGLAGEASGDDSEITVGELKSYVESAVPRLTEEHTGQPQFPTGFTFGQDFPVGLW